MPKRTQPAPFSKGRRPAARQGRQLCLVPDRIQIRPVRSSSYRGVGEPRPGDPHIWAWRWYCPCCDIGGTSGKVAWHNPDRNVPMRDRCFRRAEAHMVRYHDRHPGGQLELEV